MSLGNNKKSADKSANVVKPTTEVNINLRPDQYPWNNINKNAKNWDSKSEQAYQSFRFELFNKGGDTFMHKHLFVMLLNINTIQLRNESIERPDLSDANRGFQTKHSKVLKAYASRITKLENDNVNLSDLFSDSELLDMKIRLHDHSVRYWNRIGKPGYTPKRYEKPVVVATKADFKENDLVNAFLSN